jgi:hypothetical protein
LYYDESSSTVQTVEVDSVVGRYTSSLNLQFGSTSQVTIPNSNFIDQCFLHIELPAVVGTQTLCAGWEYALLKNISYTLGAANVSQVQITGASVKQINMLDASTREKAEAMYRLGGEPLVIPSTQIVSATICIPLPWSSMDYSKGMSLKGFDSSLLNNPIQISISFYGADRIYGNVAALPTAMSKCDFFTRERVLTDKGNSIKRQLMSAPNMLHSYPFIHRQSPSVKYNLTSLATNVIELNEFIDSDLLGIAVEVKYADDQLRGLKGAGSPPNPCASVELLDIDLKFNGQTLYKAQGHSGRLMNMIYAEGELGALADTVVNTGYTEDQITSYIYLIDLSSDKNTTFKDHYDNVSRYGGQSMSLSCYIRNHIATDVVQHPCIAELTYFFSSVAEISNGVANLQFS